MEKHHHERSTFSGRLGFVLSAAGASVGLGNIWRFPYLAAKYGGGIFLLIYIILALTFGYSMIMAETALGRMTRKSPVGAFHKFGKSKCLSFGGWINAIIPILIVPYYSVIGGWVIKYLAEYVKGNSEKLASYEKAYFKKMIDGSTDVVELTSALEKLSKMLTSHYGTAPIVIIDEYDTPIEEGYSKDFYEEIIAFMRNFFSGAFKDNKNLSYGFLTGILRIAQESIFSGLNNLTVNSVMDDEYDSYFGFTASEVHEMLAYYGVTEKEKELKDWYDGYLFGSEEIYNPWSVINYISKGCIPQAYWVNTGKNEILADVMKVATDEITERLFSLLQGERVVARIDQNVVYRSLSDNPENIYSLLLVAGYLKTPRKELQADGSYLCEVSIPNREIAAVYKSEILSHFMQIGAITGTTANRIAESLYANDHQKLQKAIAEYIDKSVSFYDVGSESFYHGLVLGLIALMDNQYKITSNRESGDGRYDIRLCPRKRNYPGIIMELKWKSKLSAEELEKLAEKALMQIDNKRYDVDMKADGIEDILKLGIAFSGKNVCIKMI